MHVPQLIEKKRDGNRLTDGEIQRLIQSFTRGDIPDYQMSALAMAIFFRGMDDAEISALTEAMLHSGRTLQWRVDAPLRVDKHSTGGIGDKTSLVLAPLLACEGLWVPMISGRGLGITGGTLDKLESIPGFRTQLSAAEVESQMERIGCVMIGQTADICPADKKLYALRDVTGTVPSIPLITASIMSKKLAEGLDRLVLDVKYGTGAFMKTAAEAEALAASMKRVGTALGVRTTAQLHAMNEPTGEAAGNALEVAEAVRCLRGEGPPDLEAMVLELACAVCDRSHDQLAARLRDGSAWQRFQAMVAAQGGDVEALENLTQRVHPAPIIVELPASHSGELTRMDAGAVGRAVLELGAGRATASDTVDFAVGCDRIAKTGCTLREGDPLLRIHARTTAAAEQARATLLTGITVQ
ncbi:MAG: thymidine phosphorylase [Verrucomicrobiales bacterium]|nr:thymidine phosphorylase [Verrucomicrobiales bacterium]